MGSSRPQCDCEEHTPCACGNARCGLCAHDPRHGTWNGYGNLKCRCESCREANTKVCYTKRAERFGGTTPAHVHGTPNGYGNYGCRCEACTTAWTVDTYDRRKRAGKMWEVPAGGEVRKWTSVPNN